MSKAALALVAAAAVFASCEKQPEAVAVQGVKLDESSILLYEGETQTLKATVTPSNATDASVTWSSDNTSVATVSDAGQVTAVKAGDAKITVTTKDGAKTATCAVTVKAKIVSVQGVSIEPTSVEMLLGEKKTLVAKVTPENASNPSVTWSSSDASIATVSQNGEVEALKTGTVSITVKTADGGFEASCSVKIDASQYNITFETNGGSAVASQVINKGDKVTKPADPTKEAGLDAGLYEGEVDPDNGSVAFGGWFTDPECTQAYDFNTVPTADLTLYAKWNSAGPQPIDLSGYEPSDPSKIEDVMWVAFDYLNSLELSEKKTYTYVVAEDNGYANARVIHNANVTIRVVGKGEPRKLSHGWADAIFKCEEGLLIIGKNIIVSGNCGGSAALLIERGDGVDMPAGTGIVMEDGSKISGVTGMGRAIVYVNNGGGTFTMKGGEISGNALNVAASSTFGGTIAVNWGYVVIEGGVIKDNVVECTNGNEAIGGAGSFPKRWNNSFVKTGGTISGNTAAYTSDAEGDKKYVGQQIIVGVKSQPAELYKIDNALGENDNVSVNDRATNPLWVKID